jgi:hypothetical protein
MRLNYMTFLRSHDEFLMGRDSNHECVRNLIQNDKFGEIMHTSLLNVLQ